MLSISMVGSLAKLEVFSENMRQVQFTVENLEQFLELPELRLGPMYSTWMLN